MVLAILIFFVVIVVLVIDIRVGVRLSYDFDSNIGEISILLFGLKIYTGEFSLVGDYINFVHNNKKVIQIRLLDIDTKTIKIVEDISKSFIRRINPLQIKTRVCMSSESPFDVSMLYGFVNTFLGVVTSLILAKNEYISIYNNVKVDYLKSELSTSFEGVFVINLYDLIWSIIRSIYLRSFGLNGKKESSKQ